MKITKFIQNIQNETWNRIRNSKSDAEARRILMMSYPDRECEAYGIKLQVMEESEIIADYHDRTIEKQAILDFSQWLLEEFNISNSGNYYLGDGKYRYNYLSPYTLNELFNIFAERK